MVLLENGSVLGQESLLLDIDDVALTTLFLLLILLLSKFSLTLLLVDGKLLLPQALDFSLVFELAHAASLGIHLLKSVILCELFHQLALEFFLHAFLFLGALSLKSELVLASSLELLTDADSLLSFGTLLGLSSLFRLLNIEVVSELLLEHLLSGSLLLFSCESPEDSVTNGLSLLLHSFDFVLTSLLLLSISADHFVFVLVHLPLALKKGPFLIL